MTRECQNNLGHSGRTRNWHINWNPLQPLDSRSCSIDASGHQAQQKGRKLKGSTTVVVRIAFHSKPMGWCYSPQSIGFPGVQHSISEPSYFQWGDTVHDCRWLGWWQHLGEPPCCGWLDLQIKGVQKTHTCQAHLRLVDPEQQVRCQLNEQLLNGSHELTVKISKSTWALSFMDSWTSAIQTQCTGIQMFSYSPAQTGY